MKTSVAQLQKIIHQHDDSNKLKDPAGEGSYAANLKSVKGVMAKSEAQSSKRWKKSKLKRK